jgi:hypothetical protein
MKRGRWQISGLADFPVTPARSRCDPNARARRGFAHVAVRVVDFPIRQVAAFLEISSLSVSTMVKMGGPLTDVQSIEAMLNY